MGVLNDVSGFIAIDDTRRSIVIAFQGTAGIIQDKVIDAFAARDETDLCIGQTTSDEDDNCSIHSGFLGQWNEAREFVLESLSKAYAAYPSYQVVITGHSMGGAVAAIGAADLRNQGYNVNLVCRFAFDG